MGKKQDEKENLSSKQKLEQNIENKLEDNKTSMIFPQKKNENIENELINQNQNSEYEIDQTKHISEIMQPKKYQIIENEAGNEYLEMEEDNLKQKQVEKFKNYPDESNQNSEIFQLKIQENFEKPFHQEIQNDIQLNIDNKNDENEYNQMIAIKNDNLDNLKLEDDPNSHFCQVISSLDRSENDKDIFKNDIRIQVHSQNILDNLIENRSIMSGNNIENINSCMHLITEEENEDESYPIKEIDHHKNQIFIQDDLALLKESTSGIKISPAFDLEDCYKHNYPRKHIENIHKTIFLNDFKSKISKYKVKSAVDCDEENLKQASSTVIDHRVFKKKESIETVFNPNEIAMNKNATNEFELPTTFGCLPLQFDNSVTCDKASIMGSADNYLLQSQQTFIHISPDSTPQRNSRLIEFESNKVDHLSKGIEIVGQLLIYSFRSKFYRKFKKFKRD